MKTTKIKKSGSAAKRKSPAVDKFLAKSAQWQDEFASLRALAVDCGLNEELKWGNPCYSVEGKGNVVLIHGFKEYCALLFFKGALLKDPKGILFQQTANVQAARQIRFKNLGEINKKKTALKAYIKEAAKLEQAGLKVKLKKTSAFKMAQEFQIELGKNPVLKKAFEALTPGRQRGYLLHFAAPKQSSTRASRVEKSKPLILKGKGLND